MKKITKIFSIMTILALFIGFIPSWNQFEFNNNWILPINNQESQVSQSDIPENQPIPSPGIPHLWSYEAKITIDGDAALAAASTTAPYGGGGSGNATHPYIIENISYSLYYVEEDVSGICIRNTTKHFVLRNCFMIEPKRWDNDKSPPDNPSGGFIFLNVTNGLVENCKVTGERKWTSDFHLTYFGFWAEDCFNLTFDSCIVSNFYDGYFSPVAFGIYSIYSTNITIKNCDILASYPIYCTNCSNLAIHDNPHISGPTDLFYYWWDQYAEIRYGISLHWTNYSLIENNNIAILGEVGEYGIGILLKESYNNIIVKNSIENYASYADIFETGDYPYNPTNSYIKLVSPENNTNYVGPEAPSPGYYPNSEGFERLPETTYPWPEPYDQEIEGSCVTKGHIWLPDSPKFIDDPDRALAIIANKTDIGEYEHKKVLKCETFNDTSLFIDWEIDQSWQNQGIFYGTAPPSGTYEFWFAKEDLGTGTIQFQFVTEYTWDDPYSDPSTIDIVLENGSFKYRDNVMLVNTSVPVKEDKWYRLSIDFCGDSSLYAGLAPNHCRFRIHDSDGHRLLYHSPAIEFLNGSVHHFQVKTTCGGGPITVFIDAPGFSWDPSYEVGDNADEGILLNFTYQKDGLLDWGFSYSVDGQQIDAPDVFLHMPSDCKKVIPLPDSEGTHTIQLIGYPFRIYIGEYLDWLYVQGKDTTSLSNINSFTLSYFNTSLTITKHTENGEVVPPGLLTLISAEDLNVSINYKSRLGIAPTMDTWMNVSYYYRINDASWNGPYNVGYFYGPQNVSFIISNTSYNSFDHVYYYLAFEQYDNEGKYLDSYYWTRNNYMQPIIVKYDESLAREFPFRKKIAPVAYDLSLNYSVFYYSQVEMTLPHVSGQNRTTYPMIGITNEDIQVDFNNLTSSMTNYSVVCVNNQTFLNHTMDAASSNISTSITPIFNYDQGIKSPFILPITLNLTVNENYTFPEMWFDGLESNRNLTFTGDLLNLTYHGVENYWPYSWRSVLKFSTYDNKHIIRYDKFTRIMIYYESINETIPNATQKMVFALFENNAGYPSNLAIETRAEVVYEDIYIIPDHLLAIVYDPPGDHSYSQLKSGTTTTVGFQIDTEVAVEEEYQYDLNILGLEISDNIQEDLERVSDYQNYDVNGTTYDDVVQIKFQKTLTSSTVSDNASFIGHGGGDLYYGSGLLVHYYVIQNFSYIVIGNESQMTVEEARDLPNQNVDDMLVWNGSFWVDYSLKLDSTFSMLGAYLSGYSHVIGNETYSLSSLLSYNVFLDNELLGNENDHVEKLPESPVFWTPGTYTEYMSSKTVTSSTITYVVTTEIPVSKSYEFGNGLYGGTGGMCVGIIGGGEYFEMSTTITTTTLDTTATETNEEILCHLEDDDGMPIGLHDQFLIDIYKDRRYNTLGFIIHEDQTYTSSPFENFSRDRRPPTTSALFDVPAYLQGNVTLHCAAVDDETGVDYVKFYYDDDPIFDIDSQLIPTETMTNVYGTVYTPTSPNVYDLTWNTSAFHGIYYLFVVTYDSATPLPNYLVSSVYSVEIDNVVPTVCQARAYGPFTGAINLYANVWDADSGIDYVEYWDGDPLNPNSTFLGRSYDSSSSYSFVWATDPGGADDGLHYIYARAYDRAGNHLDSTLLEINVNSKAPSEPISPTYLMGDLMGDRTKDLIIFIILGALIAFASVMAVLLWKSRSSSPLAPKQKDVLSTKQTLDILKTRLAKGEITQEEYIQNKKLIEESDKSVDPTFSPKKPSSDVKKTIKKSVKKAD
ncbi:MAG: hypothetical protein ACFFCM_01215 [Promethearchaeota archaeon]